MAASTLSENEKADVNVGAADVSTCSSNGSNTVLAREGSFGSGGLERPSMVRLTIVERTVSFHPALSDQSEYYEVIAIAINLQI